MHAKTNSMNITMGHQPKINRRDISLLKHTIYILGIFIIGWAPIYLLIAIDYQGNVIPLVYTILELLAVISSLSSMLDLFLYNHELRRYINDKFF
jgi:polyferredoxin